MYPYERLGVLFYVLVIFASGYLGVWTLKGLWGQAAALQKVASSSETATANRTLLVLDGIEPTSGNFE